MTRYYAGIGSRAIPASMFPVVERVATLLGARGYCCRTGGADGADEMFRQCAPRSVLHLPWLGFNGHPAGHLPIPEAFTMAQRFHPAWDRLGRGGRALQARNCHQVLGENLAHPVDLVVCWTPGGKPVGGTSQAMRVADHHRITIVNLFGMTPDEAEQTIVRMV